MKFIGTTIFFCIFISVSCFSMDARDNQNSIILFVSLGMPDNALKSYLSQAKQYHIPVVIRGLYTANDNKTSDKTIGSFNDTATRVFNLLKSQESNNNNKNNSESLKKSMGGVSINPLLFKSFDVSVVPALVVTNNDACSSDNHGPNNNQKCDLSDYDVVFGNIPIEKQLQIISEKSDNNIRSTLAIDRLNQYKIKQFG